MMDAKFYILNLQDVPQLEPDESAKVSSESSDLNSELQEVLQRLMNEPELLQDLVNSLMEPSADG